MTDVRPHVDPVLGPVFAVLMFLLCAVLANAEWIYPIRWFALLIFRTQAGLWTVFAAAIFVHCVEAVVAFRITAAMPYRFLWILLTVALGYGALRPLLSLQKEQPLLTTTPTPTRETDSQ